MSLQELEVIGVILGTFALWSRVRFIIEMFTGLIISKRRVSATAANVIIGYLVKNAKSLNSNGVLFNTRKANIKSLGRLYRVFFESTLESNKIFWCKHRLLWFRSFQSELNNRDPDYWFSFIRGSYDWDKLLLEITAWEDVVKNDIIHQRFNIYYHCENTNKNPTFSQDHTLPTVDSLATAFGIRIIGFNNEDIGDPPIIRMDQMSLTKELENIATRVERWVKDRTWYEERSIPWRLGILLHGTPGSGKTAFARCLAFNVNLPMHVFDLATHSNYSFYETWNAVLDCAPCVILIEDIDCVFNKRTPVRNDISLTYDKFLNCIGGVQKADGVLLIITTNNIDSIDPALTRGGRLDISVHVTGLDHAGRIKMATRILGDTKEAERIANDPEFINLSPADLQERLCRMALVERFGHGDFEDS